VEIGIPGVVCAVVTAVVNFIADLPEREPERTRMLDAEEVRAVSLSAARVTLYCDSSRTSMPETVALFSMGSKVMFSFPWADGFTW
jgi:hypothetical protein